ncbi:MAG: MBL fold metallo-hydrolase [Chitinophagaceae bacterium]|nr:MBL fold metallo-hydrolase [Chitinophagaceae bacterium]
MLIVIAIIIIILIIAVYVFMQRPQFGSAVSGERLELIRKSPYYKDGQFRNLSKTPALTEGASYYGVMKEFFFGRNKRGTPSAVLPSKTIDLLHLDRDKDILVWFGHSSYFMQIDGKKILVDPVLSGSASPIKFTTRSFKGSDVYTTDGIPEIDYLFITHDHWDHLDYDTIKKLKPKINKVITGLGVGEHLERWGFDKNIIIERDWNEEVLLEEGFTVNTAPARHFSGRGFKRNQTLWMSFIFQTPTMKIFIGGDSGYDKHFATIGNKFGPFDLAILENGQYDNNWKYIHMMPEEVVQASQDLNAKRLLPVHWSKFSLSVHPWDEPMIRIIEEAKRKKVELLHPLIGEPVYLNDTIQSTAWWEGLQ